MYELVKQIKFEAAHSLEDWFWSKCHNVHGHSWKLEAVVRSDELQKNAIIDLEILGAQLKRKVFDRLDHHYINEVLNEHNPTCEFLARWAYKELQPEVPYLYSVRVQETETGWATYWEGAGEEGPDPHQ